jgi:hypothetical protein
MKIVYQAILVTLALLLLDRAAVSAQERTRHAHRQVSRFA